MGPVIAIIIAAALALPIAVLYLFLKLRRIDELEVDYAARFSRMQKELDELRQQLGSREHPLKDHPPSEEEKPRSSFEQIQTLTIRGVPLPEENPSIASVISTATANTAVPPPLPQAAFQASPQKKVDLSASVPPVSEQKREATISPLSKEQTFASAQVTSASTTPELSLEQFLGVKMFAWVGGLVLFLGIAFFVKYSFEHNLIPPVMRVLIGLASGIGLGIGGMLLKKKDYKVTSDTLLATGVLVLYASVFAAHARYHLIAMPLTFAAMSAITCAAFFIAHRLNAQVVAVLGMVGGFLTPPLLSTGVDRPLALFGYVSLLNVGLLALALRRRWDYLALAGAIGTLVMQLGWLGKFYTVEKFPVAFTIFAWFNLLFAAFYWIAARHQILSLHLTGAALLLPLLTFVFGFQVAGSPVAMLHPFLFLGILILIDMICLSIATREDSIAFLSNIAGFGAFILLGIWIGQHFTPGRLGLFLVPIILFAALHSFYPIWLKRTFPEKKVGSWAHLFPALALLLMLLPVLREWEVSFLFWAGVLIVDLIAFAIALMTGAMISVLVLMILTGLLSFAWVANMPIQLPELPMVLLVISVFGIFFFTGAIFLLKRIGLAPDKVKDWSARWELQLPSLSCVMPFFLLCIIAGRFEVGNPAPIFAVALGLILMLFGLLLFSGFDAIAMVSLVCILALEFVWHESNYPRTGSAHALLWYGAFYAVFTLFPFLFAKRLKDQPLAWLASALSGPLHFFLLYQTIIDLLPGFEAKGLIPAALAIPALLGMAFIHRSNFLEGENRIRLLAWFGGSALFFITLIFPIQFEKQWLTIAWALEGAALIWLFRRVPYDKLLWLGVALLCVAFCRLGLNFGIFSYYPRSGQPIFNWYLYTFGITAAATFWSANRLRTVDERYGMLPAIRLLYTLGTVLAFWLLNIQIADYFSTGEFIRFEFSGNFGRDMTYSISWAAFALTLLIIGLAKKVVAARYASIALISVTLGKLFLHDLSELGQLHRIGAFMGVAIILIIASFLYQRFLAIQKKEQAS